MVEPRWYDGGRMQSVQTLVELDADGVAGGEWPCHADQDLGEAGIDAPVAGLVGSGQCGARHAAAETQVVEFAAPELVPRQMVQDLGANSSAGIHPPLQVMGARAGRPVLRQSPGQQCPTEPRKIG